ncbi:MAG: hypothetical protein N2746_11115 [Deltaproteobacteria bacterium]|nr:hypothetical protein [Deltaproteobacteria bacterium]
MTYKLYYKRFIKVISERNAKDIVFKILDKDIYDISKGSGEVNIRFKDLSNNDVYFVTSKRNLHNCGWCLRGNVAEVLEFSEDEKGAAIEFFCMDCIEEMKSKTDLNELLD